MHHSHLIRAAIRAAPVPLLRVLIAMKEGKDTKELSQNARAVLSELIAELERPKRTTEKPFVIAMVGTIASGKTTVGAALAERLGATFIRGDKVRLALRERGERHEATRQIIERAAAQLVIGGCSVVIDTDFVDKEKRAALEEVLGGRAPVRYMRCVAPADVCFRRIRETDYGAYPNIFAVASSSSGAVDSAVDVRLREFWRRTPRHFKWLDEGGGKWRLREMPFAAATIETADEEAAREHIDAFADTLKGGGA